jgi:hypothetical protein
MEQPIDQAKRQGLFSEICISTPDNYVDDFTTPLTELETFLQNLITTLFVDSFKAYNTCITDNKQHIELQKLAKLHLSERKAEDVAMIIDNEPSVNAETLNKIINDKVAELLAKELKKLKQPKNDHTDNKKSTTNSNSKTNSSDKKNNNSNNNKNNLNTNRTNNNRTNNRNNDTSTSTTDNNSPKNNQRGAQSASSKKKSKNTQGDRNNASPKRKREDSNNSSKKTKKNNNKNTNERSTK